MDSSSRILTYGIDAITAPVCTKLASYSLTKSLDNITFGGPEEGSISRGKNDHLWTDHLWTLSEVRDVQLVGEALRRIPDRRGR